MNLFSLTNKPESIAHYERSKAIEINMALSAPEKAYQYANNILKDRFKAGENIIATNAYYFYLYANNVLKNRLQLKEFAVLPSAYKENIIHVSLTNVHGSML
jgi:hypothetical protein